MERPFGASFGDFSVMHQTNEELAKAARREEIDKSIQNTYRGEYTTTQKVDGGIRKTTWKNGVVVKRVRINN